METVQAVKGPYECPHCGTDFYVNDVKEYMGSYVFRCSKCEMLTPVVFEAVEAENIIPLMPSPLIPNHRRIDDPWET